MLRLLTLILLIPASAHAVTCNVPASYPSIQAAVNDSSCSEIQLSPGVYEGSVNISRSLTLVGSGPNETAVKGVVSVSGNTTEVIAQSFRISSGNCTGSWLTSSGGASLSGINLFSQFSPPAQCQLPELIFTDGFESSP